jgi:hypothetical protein
MKLSNMSSNVVNYLEGLAYNPWAGTILEGYYALNPASKGSKGEQAVEEMLKQLGYDVQRRKNAGHDRVINGVKTEIKFALAVNRNENFQCIFNHIGMEKDWDEIILCCVNGDMEIRMVSFTKDNFPLELCSRQQGGKSGGNDDFMCNANNSFDLLYHEDAKVLF